MSSFFFLFDNFKTFSSSSKYKCIAGKPGACINWGCDEYVLVRDNLFHPYKKCKRDINRLDRYIRRLFIKKITTLKNIKNIDTGGSEIKFEYEKNKRCILIVSFPEETIKENMDYLKNFYKWSNNKGNLGYLISEEEYEILLRKLNKYK